MSDIYKKVSDKELLLLPHKDCVRFALFCAEQVRDSWKDIPECVAAIETAERWLEGKAAEEECVNAADAAASAAVNAADAAASAAANAADAAAYAAAYAAFADAYYATYAADAADAYANATSSAAYAAYVAYYACAAGGFSSQLVIKEQREYYNELLHFDDIAERALLGTSG